MKEWTVPVCLVIACALLAGCGESVDPIGPGTLNVQWELRPDGCETAGVETIEVRLELDDRHASGRRSEIVDCENGEATVDGLPGANYKLWVFGRDSADDITYAAGPREVTVYAEQANTAPVLSLTARPAELMVGWRFADGRVCGAHDVRRVAVDVFDKTGFRLVHRTAPCTDGSTVVEDVPPGEHRVEIRAPVGDNTAYTGRSEVTFRPAKRSDAELILSPIAD